MKNLSLKHGISILITIVISFSTTSSSFGAPTTQKPDVNTYALQGIGFTILQHVMNQVGGEIVGLDKEEHKLGGSITIDNSQDNAEIIRFNQFTMRRSVFEHYKINGAISLPFIEENFVAFNPEGFSYTHIYPEDKLTFTIKHFKIVFQDIEDKYNSGNFTALFEIDYDSRITGPVKIRTVKPLFYDRGVPTYSGQMFTDAVAGQLAIEYKSKIKTVTIINESENYSHRRIKIEEDGLSNKLVWRDFGLWELRKYLNLSTTSDLPFL